MSGAPHITEMFYPVSPCRYCSRSYEMGVDLVMTKGMSASFRVRLGIGLGSDRATHRCKPDRLHSAK